MDLVFKPVLLGLWLLTLQPNSSHVTDLNGPAIELQTSATGWGAHAMLSSRAIMGAGVHYGFAWALTDRLAVIAQPFAGVSHTFTPVRELPLGTQFEVGLTLMARYGHGFAGAKYWHASCAWFCDRNPGVDVVGPLFGFTF